jgi:hypothetical protein
MTNFNSIFTNTIKSRILRKTCEQTMILREPRHLHPQTCDNQICCYNLSATMK